LPPTGYKMLSSFRDMPATHSAHSAVTPRHALKSTKNDKVATHERSRRAMRRSPRLAASSLSLHDAIFKDKAEDAIFKEMLKSRNVLIALLHRMPAFTDAMTSVGVKWPDIKDSFDEMPGAELLALLDASHKVIEAIVRQSSEGQQVGCKRARPGTTIEGATLLSAEEEQELRHFDLDLRFGPSIGIGRLNRWLRALRLGLKPPPSVLQILESLDDEDPAHQTSWSKRL